MHDGHEEVRGRGRREGVRASRRKGGWVELDCLDTQRWGGGEGGREGGREEAYIANGENEGEVG